MAQLNRKHIRLLAICLVFVLFLFIIFFRFFLGRLSEIVVGKPLYAERIITPDSFLDFGEKAQKDNRTQMAADIYALGAKYFPSSLDLWTSMAASEEALGHIPEAIEAWNNIIRLNPQGAPGYFQLGDLYARTSQYTLALEQMQKAVEFDPKTPYLQRYVQILNLNQRFSDSAHIYRLLAEREPGIEDWVFGEKWAATQPVKTEEDYLAEIRSELLKRENQEANRLLKEYNILFGMTAQLQIILAEATYLKLLQQNSLDAQTWYQLANFYDQQSRTKEAEWAIRKAVEIDPKNLQYLSFFAYIELKLKEWSAANALYKEMLSLDPESKHLNKEYALLTKLFPLTLEQPEVSFRSLLTESELQFETYVDWWSKNWEEALATMPMVDGMVVNIAFNDWGKPFKEQEEKRVIEMLQKIQTRAAQEKIKVIYKLSFGGSTYALPSMATAEEAKEHARLLVERLDYIYKTYGFEFDGIDLDIESKNNNAENLAVFVKAVREELKAWRESHKILSLTIVGQAWTGVYYELAIHPDVINAVDYIQFMEYGGLNIQTTSLANQIENDILTYMAPFGSSGPIPKRLGWGIPREKIVLGLKPGEDHGQYLSPESTQQLAEFAKQERLKGVMIWSTFRDAEGESATGQPPFTYTRTIFKVLYPHKNVFANPKETL